MLKKTIFESNFIIMKEFIDDLVDYFIHPRLKNNLELYEQSKTSVKAYLLSSFFIISYVTIFEILDKNLTVIKLTCNYIGVIACISTLLLIKWRGTLVASMYIHMFMFLMLISITAYYSGGIYSVDLFWIIIIPMFTFMYNNRKAGYVILTMSLLIFIYFYYMEVHNYRNFRLDNITIGINYEFYNLIAILIFSSMITVFFVSGSQKIKHQLAALRDKELRSIDSKFQYIIENATEIISLHNKNIEVTYISPSVKTILEYDPEELIGVNCRSLFGIESTEYNLPFLQECTTKTGRKVWLEITMNKIYDEIGKGDRFISLARDVTASVLENKRINELREQIANDFHDEIGNKLAAITLNANVLSIKTKDDTELTAILNKIQETSKSLYQNSRDFIWSIDSKSDKLDEIYLYIRDFGEDLFQSLSIHFLPESTNQIILEHVKLPMYSGRHIILICTEILTNAAKHSKCNTVTLSFDLTGDLFTIKITDNGIGFNPNESKSCKGMTSIKKRAAIIGFSLEIKSNTESKGTCISLSKKIQNNKQSI